MELSFLNWTLFFAVYFGIGILISRGVITYRQSRDLNDWEQFSFPMGLFWPVWIPLYFAAKAIGVALDEMEQLTERAMYYVDAMFRKIFKMPAVEKPWVERRREQKAREAKMEAAAFRDWATDTEALKHEMEACTDPVRYQKLEAQQSALYAYGIERKWCSPT